MTIGTPGVHGEGVTQRHGLSDQTKPQSPILLATRRLCEVGLWSKNLTRTSTILPIEHGGRGFDGQTSIFLSFFFFPLDLHSPCFAYRTRVLNCVVEAVSGAVVLLDNASVTVKGGISETILVLYDRLPSGTRRDYLQRFNFKKRGWEGYLVWRLSG